jgi:hypothetical protein
MNHHAKRHFARPQLEEFEPRCLLSSDTWTGAVNADWATAGNWSAGVPGSTTDVILSATTGTPDPVINAPGNCGSITTASAFFNHVLTLQSGSLTVTGNGLVSPSTWSDGNILVAVGATIHIGDTLN